MIDRPRYVPSAARPKVDYKWDDWDPYEVIGEQKDEIIEKLSEISLLGNCAFSLGCAEWIIFSIKELATDEYSLNFLEACWARLISMGEYKMPSTEELPKRKGRVLMPGALALATVVNTFGHIESGDTEFEAAFAEQLTSHVMEEKPFVLWRDGVLQRLKSDFPRINEGPLGEPVPREVLDLRLAPTAEERAQLNEQFLQKVRQSKNPLLRQPKPRDEARKGRK